MDDVTHAVVGTAHVTFSRVNQTKAYDIALHGWTNQLVFHQGVDVSGIGKT